jgi:hypothetical protein
MLDLSTNEQHHDGFFAVTLPILKGRLVQIAEAAEKESAHAVFLALEAKGEILPYFMNEPKTAFGLIHQGTLYNLVPKLFADPTTQTTLQSTIERLQQDTTYRNQAYAEYDSQVRPYSLAHEVDIVDMLYGGSDPMAISELMQIMTKCEEGAKPVHDRIALGYIYIIGRQMDPEIFFRAEQGEAGVAKRNSQGQYTGLGLHLQERVFRALLDFGQYFEDRYKDFRESLPKPARRVRR